MILEKIESKLRNSRISTRITIFLVLILILTFGSYTAFTIYYGQKRSTSVFVEQVNFLGKTVERILRINMLENQPADIQLALNEIQQSEDIRQIKLFNNAFKNLSSVKIRI